MKTLITLTTLTLITLSPSCRTSKVSTREKARLDVQEQSDVKTRVQESNHYNRFESLTDSNGQSYQLTIFPADTFRFSIKDGFIGKASKVIVTGSSKQLIRIADTSKFAGSVTSELEETMTRDVTAKMKDRSVQIEWKGVIWNAIGIGLIVVLVMMGLWRKLRAD